MIRQEDDVTCGCRFGKLRRADHYVSHGSPPKLLEGLLYLSRHSRHRLCGLFYQMESFGFVRETGAVKPPWSAIGRKPLGPLDFIVGGFPCDDFCLAW